jgi:hypothetical protein
MMDASGVFEEGADPVLFCGSPADCPPPPPVPRLCASPPHAPQENESGVSQAIQIAVYDPVTGEERCVDGLPDDQSIIVTLAYDNATSAQVAPPPLRRSPRR